MNYLKYFLTITLIVLFGCKPQVNPEAITGKWKFDRNSVYIEFSDETPQHLSDLYQSQVEQLLLKNENQWFIDNACFYFSKNHEMYIIEDGSMLVDEMTLDEDILRNYSEGKFNWWIYDDILTIEGEFMQKYRFNGKINFKISKLSNNNLELQLDQQEFLRVRYEEGYEEIPENFSNYVKKVFIRLVKEN